MKAILADRFISATALSALGALVRWFKLFTYMEIIRVCAELLLIMLSQITINSVITEWQRYDEYCI